MEACEPPSVQTAVAESVAAIVPKTLMWPHVLFSQMLILSWLGGETKTKKEKQQIALESRRELSFHHSVL